MQNDKIVQLIVKVPQELRDSFKKLAMLNDSTMADEIRRFMEEYVNQYQAPTARKKAIKRKEGEVIDGEKESQNS